MLSLYRVPKIACTYALPALVWLLIFSGILTASPLSQAASSPLYWQVQGHSSGQGEVIMLGSIHFGHQTLYPLPAPLMAAYERADLLAVEVDMTAVHPQRVAAVMATHGYYPEGQNLRQQIGEWDWQALTAVCEQLGIEVEHFLPLKPWLVALQLVGLQVQETEYSKALGIDQYFLQRARQQKAIYELETIEEQISMFSRFSDDEQILFLRQTLSEYAQGKVFLDEIVRAWQMADQSALEQMVLESFRQEGGTENMFQLVFTERNQRMVAAVEQFLAQGKSVFLVVGVGHMLGEQGLVEELRRRGYTVRLGVESPEPIADGQ